LQWSFTLVMYLCLVILRTAAVANLHYRCAIS